MMSPLRHQRTEPRAEAPAIRGGALLRYGAVRRRMWIRREAAARGHPRRAPRRRRIVASPRRLHPDLAMGIALRPHVHRAIREGEPRGGRRATDGDLRDGSAGLARTGDSRRLRRERGRVGARGASQGCDEVLSERGQHVPIGMAGKQIHVPTGGGGAGISVCADPSSAASPLRDALGPGMFVRSSDDLTAIAAQNGTTVDAILADPNNVDRKDGHPEGSRRPGDIVFLPSVEQASFSLQPGRSTTFTSELPRSR